MQKYQYYCKIATFATRNCKESLARSAAFENAYYGKKCKTYRPKPGEDTCGNKIGGVGACHFKEKGRYKQARKRREYGY